MADPNLPEASPASTPVRRRMAVAVVALSFLFLGIAEGLSLPGSGRAALVFAAAGLTGLAGLVLGLVAALLLPPWLRRWQTGGRALFLTGGGAEGAAEARLAFTSDLLGFALCLGPLMLATAVAGRVAHGFVQGGFAAPFVALGALAGAALAVLAFPAVRDALLFLLRRVFPSGRIGTVPLPAVIVALGALSAVAAGGFVLTRIDVGAWRLGWLGGVGLAVVAAGVAGAAAPVRRRLGGLLGLAFVVAVVLWSAASIGTFADNPAARTSIPKDGGLSRVVVQVLRGAFDRDGDGASAALAGGDCDDTNPEVGPAASEVPGNGIDDNCEGGDAPLEAEEAPVPASASAAPTSDGVNAPASAASPDAPRWNVVLIIIDTLRPDHLGLYGYERPTSPNLDAFARGAVVFERALATAPNTPRSMPSIFTGRYPSRIAWVKRFANYGALKPENETMFERLTAAGYYTEVQSAHWYWDKVPEIKTGVARWDNRGALSISESNTQSPAPDLTPRVVARLDALPTESGGKPFFLFAHYFDPHSRYMNHPEVKEFGTSLMDKYDSEIAFTDHHLKPVFEALSRGPHPEKTMVVITSDHGESFKDHGFHFHGRTVYQDEVGVPLVIRAPGLSAGRSDVVASLVDLLPTVTAAAGAACADCPGIDLVGVATGRRPRPERVVFAEQLPYPNYEVHMVGALDHLGQKLIRNLTENTVELYDLKTDAPEKQNLIGTEHPAEKPLRAALTKFVEGDRGR
jgi:choline-sulfatase